MKPKTYTLEQARKLLENYCVYQERSHFQVEKKLREMRMIPEAIDSIVLHLIQEGFLNEERFARAYVRGKFYYKDWGKNKIRQGLKKHLIHLSLIENALGEINPDDYNKTIKKIIDKKKQEYSKIKSYQLRQKILAYLYQKGYSPEDVIPLLNI